MTSYEMEFKISVMNSLKAIAHEIKKSNELKAIELKSHLDLKLDAKMVDEIMDDES